MSKIFLFLLTVLCVSSCSNRVKEKIGIVTTGPNEYEIHTNKPLEVPPHYNLPTPSFSHSSNLDNASSASAETDTPLNDGEKALVKELDSDNKPK